MFVASMDENPLGNIGNYIGSGILLTKFNIFSKLFDGININKKIKICMVLSMCFLYQIIQILIERLKYQPLNIMTPLYYFRNIYEIFKYKKWNKTTSNLYIIKDLESDSICGSKLNTDKVTIEILYMILDMNKGFNNKNFTDEFDNEIDHILKQIGTTLFYPDCRNLKLTEDVSITTYPCITKRKEKIYRIELSYNPDFNLKRFIDKLNKNLENRQIVKLTEENVGWKYIKTEHGKMKFFKVQLRCGFQLKDIKDKNIKKMLISRLDEFIGQYTDKTKPSHCNLPILIIGDTEVGKSELSRSIVKYVETALDKILEIISIDLEHINNIENIINIMFTKNINGKKLEENGVIIFDNTDHVNNPFSVKKVEKEENMKENKIENLSREFKKALSSFDSPNGLGPIISTTTEEYELMKLDPELLSRFDKHRGLTLHIKPGQIY